MTQLPGDTHISKKFYSLSTGAQKTELATIVVNVLAAQAMRYPTCGDWFSSTGFLNIQVSRTGNWKFDLLLVIHELCEAGLCAAAGVTQQQVDAYDMGPGVSSTEPGTDDDAPYFQQHAQASIIEKLLAEFLDVDWQEYEKVIDSIDFSKPGVGANAPVV